MPRIGVPIFGGSASIIHIQKATECPNCNATERLFWTFSNKRYNINNKIYYAYHICDGCKYCWDKDGAVV